MSTIHIDAPLAPAASGAVGTLRPVRPNDLAWIEDAVFGPLVPYRWRTRGATPGPDVLNRTLWADVMTQFVVDDGRPLALLQAFDVDLRNATAQVAVLPSPLQQVPSQLRPATSLFFAHVFGPCQLRKVYVQSLSSVTASTLEMLPEGGVHEGTLQDAEVVPGGYDDLETHTWTAATR